MVSSLVLCLIWVGWVTLARVSVHVVSQSSRVEVDGAAFHVDSPVTARVRLVHLSLGEVVEASEPLVELDASQQRRSLAETEARRAGLVSQIEALASQLDALRQVVEDMQEGSHAAATEARSRANAAAASASAARDRARRVRGMRSETLPAVEAREIQSRARETAQSARAARAAAERTQWDTRAAISERRAQIAALEREHANLQGQLEETEQSLTRLNEDIARRTLRAPAAGRIGEFRTLRPGTLVQEGDRIGTIVPTGRLHVVAQLSPGSALGRVRPGQPAIVRLDAFPWTRFGTVAARVERVGREVRDEHLPVELSLDPASAPDIPLQHGLTGTCEIEVERIPPLWLLLRAAGLGGDRR